MVDIESLGFPLVYKAAVNETAPPGLSVREDNIAVRTAVRCLTRITIE